VCEVRIRTVGIVFPEERGDGRGVLRLGFEVRASRFEMRMEVKMGRGVGKIYRPRGIG
jgi:hypothetical protein